MERVSGEAMNTQRPRSEVTCTRRLHACVGHRVMGHEGHCAHPHGHNYYFEVTARAAGGLDSLGRVVDFAVLKERVGGWIEKHWDHGFVHHIADAAVVEMLDVFDGALARRGREGAFDRNAVADASAGAPCKRFALPYNPTAENLARFLLEDVCRIILADSGVEVVRIVVHETDNCQAEARLL